MTVFKSNGYYLLTGKVCYFKKNTIRIIISDIRTWGDRTHRRRRMQILGVDWPRANGQRLSHRT